MARGGPLIVGGIAGILAVAWLSARSSRGTSAEATEDLLRAQFGPLGAGLRWQDAVYLPVADELGLDNLPPAPDARRLQVLAGEVLAPVTNLYGLPWMITGGYRRPAVARVCPGCPLRGHDDGTALDVRLAGVSPGEALLKLVHSGAPFRRAVLTGNHLHVEAGTGRLGVFVQLPGGMLVPAETA